MSEAAKQSELETLRAEVESYRQRELTQLWEQLAAARADATHYRAEAERNADLGRKIHLESQSELNRLRDRLQTVEQLPNARVPVAAKTS